MRETPLDRSSSTPLSATRRDLADGRYILVRKVAEGGTAFVHLGYDTWTETWRAVKTLLPEYAKRPALRHRFEREAATMKTLSHDNIIAVYDAGIEEDTVFMVMEFAEGGSVIDWVERNGPMPPRMATTVVVELCRGIDAAHRQGVVHRDIKPQNLLVDRHGVCKVTDFGIAQVLEQTRMTMTGTVMGTMGYMAPEQNESAKHADERADVYSIAATYYTLIKGEAATHLFMAEEQDFDGIPPNLAAIIRRGSNYRKEQRYQTVSEMMQELESALRLLAPDPLDTPPLVPHDIPNLEDFTPPSFDPGVSASHAGAPAMLVPHQSVVDPEPEPDRFEGYVIGVGVEEEISDPQSLEQLTTPQPELFVEPERRLDIRRTPPALDRITPGRHRELIRAVAIGLGTVALLAGFAALGLATLAASQVERYESVIRHEYQKIVMMAHERVQGQVLPGCDSVASLGLDCNGCGELDARLNELAEARDPQVRLANARRLRIVVSNVCRCVADHVPTYDRLKGPMFNTCRVSEDLEEALLAYDTLVQTCEAELEEAGGGLARTMGLIDEPACVNR